MRRVFVIPVVLVVLALAIVSSFVVSTGRSLNTRPGGFDEVRVGRTVRLHSMGVADFTSDGQLDIFTNNHAASALFLENLGGLSFEDRRLKLGLSSNVEFPGAELSETGPVDRPDGLHIYWQMGDLRLTSKGSSPETPHVLRLTLNAPVVVGVDEATAVDPSGPVIGAAEPISIRFTSDGAVAFSSLDWIIGGVVELADSMHLEDVSVGLGQVNPKKHRFALASGADRHGIAWTDINGDGRQDAMFVEGGASGKMQEAEPYPVAFGSQDGFSEVASVQGLNQELCPSRQVTLTDADRDGNEDIHVICGRGLPPRQDHPHEIFLRRGQSAYANRMDELGLELGGNGLARWADLDGDGSQDLVWADRRGVRIFVRKDGEYATQFSVDRRGEKSQIAFGDIDGDGDIDAYVASLSDTSVVIIDDAGVFRAVEPLDLGLPTTATCANFVDVDLDGQDELFTLPEGISVRSSSGEFRSDALLSGPADFRPHCQWFDADNDGDRDLLLAIPPSSSLADRVARKATETLGAWRYSDFGQGRVFQPLIHELVIYRNDAHSTTSNSWLAVDVVGPRGFPNGIGARVEVETQDGITSREVGHAEGSTSSMGHYRVYFGLGNADAIDMVTIDWPDGRRDQFPAVEKNQIIALRHPELEDNDAAATTVERIEYRSP